MTADDLTFHHFNVDVVINDGENEIYWRTPALPVIDFVLMIVQLCREVVAHCESRVEPSLSQNWIAAVVNDECVEIFYSFSNAISSVSLVEFKVIPENALQAALIVLCGAHGDLRSNDFLKSISGSIEKENV